MKICPHCGEALVLTPREMDMMRLLRPAPEGVEVQALMDRLGVAYGTINRMVWKVRQKVAGDAIINTWGAYKLGETGRRFLAGERL